jgi:ariadne-1
MEKAAEADINQNYSCEDKMEFPVQTLTTAEVCEQMQSHVNKLVPCMSKVSFHNCLLSSNFLTFFLIYYQLSRTVIRHLLNHFKWNSEKLLDRFYDSEDQREFFKSAGLQSPLKRKHDAIKDLEERCCDICYSDDFDERPIDLICGHLFCAPCFEQYLDVQLSTNGQSSVLQCAGFECKWIIDDELILAHLDQKEKYEEMICRSYVNCNRDLTHCPAPNCKFIIECFSAAQQKVKCRCGQEFCFFCRTLDSHSPLPCALIVAWEKLLIKPEEKFSQEWISTYTRPCPKCNVRIDKNGGCNHMHCKKCETHFCWLCNGIYVSGSNHSCDLYSPYREEEILPQFQFAVGSSRMDQTQIRSSSISQQFALGKKSSSQFKEHRFYYYKDRFNAVNEKFKTETEKFSALKPDDNQLVVKCFDTLKLCRKILIQGYIFAFFMKPGNEKVIFEENFKSLGDSTEELSRMMIEYLGKDLYADERAILEHQILRKLV